MEARSECYNKPNCYWGQLRTLCAAQLASDVLQELRQEQPARGRFSDLRQDCVKVAAAWRDQPCSRMTGSLMESHQFGRNGSQMKPTEFPQEGSAASGDQTIPWNVFWLLSPVLLSQKPCSAPHQRSSAAVLPCLKKYPLLPSCFIPAKADFFARPSTFGHLLNVDDTSGFHQFWEDSPLHK